MNSEVTEHRPKPSLARDAVYVNSFKSIHPWASSTGFRSYGFQYRTINRQHDPGIAEEFLINTRLRRFDREFELSVLSYFSDSAAVMSSMLGEEPASEQVQVTLPNVFELQMELGEAMRRRRSHRSFTGEALRLDDLSVLVRSAGAVTAKGETHLRGGGSWVRLRITPSGGALYPIEVQLAALNVRDINPGLYRYDPLTDKLLGIGDKPAMDRFLAAFAVRDDVITISRASLVFVLIGQPWRAMRKYGSRGMRLLFFEAGQISQNIHLAAVSLGLGSVDCASIYDDEAHEALGIDGVYQTLLHTLVIGDPA